MISTLVARKLSIAAMHYLVKDDNIRAFAAVDGIMQITKELDTSGLICPMPILQAKKALNGLTSGQLLRVVSTDSVAFADFVSFARATGNKLLGSYQVAESYYFIIEKQ